MKDPIKDFGFKPENYRILFIGLGINVLGFLLMIGGGTDNPNEFDGDALFSHIRITVAPILITLGYAVMIYSIMKKPVVTASSPTVNAEVEIENTVEKPKETPSSKKKKSGSRSKKGKR